MTTVRELVTQIGFDVDDQELNELDDALGTINDTLFQVASFATAAAAAIFGMTVSVAQTGDEIAKTARDVGVSTEALQKLRFAAELAGISTNELDKGLESFARRIGQARDGTGPAADALDELGVSIRDSNGDLRDNEDILQDIADAMVHVENESERAALAQDLFGRAGLRMGTFLSQGSESITQAGNRLEDLGGILSDEAIAESEKFNDTFLEARTAVMGMVNALGAELMPMVTETVELFIDWIRENRELISQRLDRLFQFLAQSVRVAWMALNAIINTFVSLSRIVGGVENALWLLMGVFLFMRALRIAMALITIGRTFITVGRSALFANASIAAIPLAIIAIVAAVALLIWWVWNWFESTEDAVGDINALFDWLGAQILSIFETLSEVIPVFFGVLIERLIDLFWMFLQWLSGATLDALIFVLDTFIQIFDAILMIITGIIELAVHYIMDAFWAALDFVWKAFSNAFTSIGDFILGIFQGIIQAIANLWGSMVNAVTNIFSSLGNMVSSVFSSIADGILGVINSVIKQINKIPGVNFSELGGASVDINTSFNTSDLDDVIAGFTTDVNGDPVREVAQSRDLERPVTQNNINSEINITAPQGSDREQQEFLKEAAKQAFREEYEREVDSLLRQNPELE